MRVVWGLGVLWVMVVSGGRVYAVDVIETRAGARLVGTIKKLDGQVITLATDYAGDLAIKQSEVVGVQSEIVRFLRLEGGDVVMGIVTTTPEGEVRIKGDDEYTFTTVDKLRGTWTYGEVDPEIEAQRPKWRYEGGVDVTGRTGNREQFGTALNVLAQRTGPLDDLKLYGSYNRQRSDEVVSTDQLKLGLDYSNHYAGRNLWYARDELGYDGVKDIQLYNLSALGLGYDFIKNEKELLTGRSGLAFRYESYNDKNQPAVKDIGLDFGLHREYRFGRSRLVSDITFVPAMNDFTNFRALHESYFEMPTELLWWKVRIGVTNDYISRPSDEVSKLDTIYFTRFVFNWK